MTKFTEYDMIIDKLVQKFDDVIPEEEKELTIKFREYLYKAIENLKKSDLKFVRKDKQSIESTLNRITNRFISFDLQEKQQELLIDDNFEEMKKISNTIYNIAKSIMEGNSQKVDFDIAEEKERLYTLFNLVKPYNIELAKRLVSETIVELNYISNPETDILSLRLGAIREESKREKEES